MGTVHLWGLLGSTREDDDARQLVSLAKQGIEYTGERKVPVVRADYSGDSRALDWMRDLSCVKRQV